ncbi:AraC family transcriptional regulator [Pseudomonas sp. OIL-1]|uniref:helix-turn-helix domain-containing protein n=1 Tax=Pseudomonas sp. OIL-1 TaxID=2706126 RepID=UPI0013A7845D|nr:AraC family transcriptional regulator [Pseudomonas sp. OIL-1]QIB52646.1 AraC family transcriptional regulator [Pseudomonas sp. OIL-1]
MPEALMNYNARVRERPLWASVVAQALHHYGISLQQPSPAYTLMEENRDASRLMEQDACSLIWDEATRLTEDDLFGMRLYRMFCPTSFNAIALIAQASPTVGTALQNISRFLPVVTTQVTVELCHSEDDTEVVLHPLGKPHTQHMESLMGFLARLFRMLDLNNEELVRSIQLGRMPGELSGCARLLGCSELTVGDDYRFRLAGHLFTSPLASADAFLLSRFTDAMQDLLASLPSDDLVEQVKRRIQQLLGSGDVSAERIAAPMNISSRHLRRKLSQAGTSYEQLVDEVRRDAAVRMITGGELSLTSIAYELGFLDPSSFTRAFRRWTDMSPTAFRRQVVASE